MNRYSHTGFTLIELMIVVVIVGVLMMVGLPAYQDSLQKGRRADGMSALMDAASRQEKFMLDRSTYTVDMEELGYAGDPYISQERHYGITAAACDGGSIANCYELTATPRPDSVQLKDTKCTTFILDSSGNRTATGSLAAECW